MAEIPKPDRPIKEFFLKNENEHHIAFYVALGRVVFQWGRLEQSFAYMVARLYHIHGGKTLASEPPFAVKRQIEFWKACFKELETLEPLRRMAKDFITEFAKAKTARDSLLHFSWARQPLTGEGAKGRSLRATSKGHVQEDMDLSVEALIAFTKRIDHIYGLMFPLSFILVRKIRWTER